MKSYHLDQAGSLDGLVVREHDIPAPGPRHVLVRMRANALNDTLCDRRSRHHHLPPRLARRPAAPGAAAGPEHCAGHAHRIRGGA